MARHLYGTVGNDDLEGDSSTVNFFHNVGTGFDGAFGGKFNDRFFMHVDKFIDKVDGGDGQDTIDYSDSDRGLNIDLSTGVVKANFGGPETPLSIWTQVTDVRNVEDVVGSKFNDTITGTSGENRLDGGAGNDVIHAGDGSDTLIGGLGTNTLDGGKGMDTADYSSSQYSVFASLATGQGAEVDIAHGSIASQDSYVSIENLTGSSHADILIGDAKVNVIDAGDGGDVVQGGGGGDTLHGGKGDDQIIGDTFGSAAASSTTSMFGDDGNDTLYGSAGKDLMDGGTGSDWADYTQQDIDGQNAPGAHWGNYSYNPGVTVDLSSGTGHSGYAEGDTYVSIENVRGTDGDDTITGDSNDNTLVGLGGNNVIHGGDGNDTLMGTGQLFGDNGDDRFMSGGSGTTVYDGGAGSDTVDYSQSSNRVVVDLGGTLSIFGIHSGQIDSAGHQVSQDSYSNIENIAGSGLGDMIFGDNNDNVVDGNGGNDVLYGFGGNDTINGEQGDDIIEGGFGTDHLDGGDGVNTLAYDMSASGVVINLVNGTAAGGDASGDVISNFQNVVGSGHDDVLVGSNANNLFFEQAGNNLMVGGGGQDTFAFSSLLTGNTMVADFHVGEDKLAFVGQFGVQGVSDLHISQAGGSTLITFEHATGSVMLVGINALDFVQHASTELVFSQTLDPLLHG